MKSIPALIVLLVLLLGVGDYTQAGDVVAYAFSAAVSENPGSPYGLSVSEGDRVYGTFVYEIGASNQFYNPPVDVFSVSLGGATFDQWGSYYVYIGNGAPGTASSDWIEVGGSIVDTENQTTGNIGVGLSDSTATVFSDAVLPVELPFSHFDSALGIVAENEVGSVIFSLDGLFRGAVRLPDNGHFGDPTGWFRGLPPAAGERAIFSLSPDTTIIDFLANAKTSELVVLNSDVTLALSGNSYVIGDGTTPAGLQGISIQAGGLITVDGPEAILRIPGGAQSQDVLVGGEGYGEVQISGGGTAEINSRLTLGAESGAKGAVSIWDAGSNLTLDQPSLTIGKAGQGNLLLGDGATMTLQQPTSVVVADEEGSFGLVYVGGSSWDIDSLVVGNSGMGNMQVISGAAVTVTGDVAVAVNPGADNSSLMVGSSGSTLDVGGKMTLGGQVAAMLGIFDAAAVRVATLEARASSSVLLDNGTLEAGMLILRNGASLRCESSVVRATTLEADSGSDITLTHGTLADGVVSLATGASLYGSGTISADLENNGTVTGTGVESLTLSGYVTGNGSYVGESMFSGTFSPGNGIAVVNTEYFALIEPGTLRMELGGNDATGQRDQLVATTAYFAGALEVVLVDPFQPIEGDVFTIFNSGDYYGTLADMNLPDLTDPDLFWGTSSLFVDGSLTVIALPPAQDVAEDVGQGAQSIDLLGGSGSERGVAVTFSNVTSGGDFTVEQINVEEDADLGGFEFDSFDFQLPGETAQLWEMGFGGVFEGQVTLDFHYIDELLGPGVDENTLTVFHYVEGEWMELIPLGIDAENNILTVQTDGFSPFALGAVPIPEPSTLLLAIVGALILAAYGVGHTGSGRY